MAERFLDKRWPWLVAAAALIFLFLYSIVERPRDVSADPRPTGSADDIARLKDRADVNLLFIVVDTLRAEHLGSYGYTRDTSPTLDRLAATGARFARHLSQSSWTKASMASLWTGVNPPRTGITRFDDVLPEEARMPAEILRDAGFRTSGIFRNGWVAPTFGFDQGFEIYTRPIPKPLGPSVRVHNPTLRNGGTDEDAVAAALEFLRIHGEERWFLYLHFMDVHQYTYDQESALFGTKYADVYDNSVRFTDGTLSLLLEYLSAWGLRENTLIAIASDHGEAFRERGFEGHARRVYRETTEVPFVLAFPFRLEPGVVIETRTRNVDVWPTLLDLIGVTPAVDGDGRSLVPDILASARGEAPPADDRTGIALLDQHWGVRNEQSAFVVAIVDGSYRYVRTDQEGPPLEQLFDADSDPRELHDRSKQEPEVLERLRGIADSYVQAPLAWGAAPKREIDELELNQLRALGYAVP